MMEEYLWNKTGSDPEIERIEAALKSLAYRPGEPPALPAKQLVFTAPRRLVFRFGFSFAAAFLAIAALGTAWLLLRNDRRVDQQAAAVRELSDIPKTVIRTETAPAAAVPAKLSVNNRPRKRVAAPIPQEPNTIRPQTLVLTAEEADAYRQLMTALSITSTNLKIVKDKLDGTE